MPSYAKGGLGYGLYEGARQVGNVLMQVAAAKRARAIEDWERQLRQDEHRMAREQHREYIDSIQRQEQREAMDRRWNRERELAAWEAQYGAEPVVIPGATETSLAVPEGMGFEAAEGGYIREPLDPRHPGYMPQVIDYGEPDPERSFDYRLGEAQRAADVEAEKELARFYTDLGFSPTGARYRPAQSYLPERDYERAGYIATEILQQVGYDPQAAIEEASARNYDQDMQDAVETEIWRRAEEYRRRNNLLPGMLPGDEDFGDPYRREPSEEEEGGRRWWHNLGNFFVPGQPFGPPEEGGMEGAAAPVEPSRPGMMHDEPEVAGAPSGLRGFGFPEELLGAEPGGDSEFRGAYLDMLRGMRGAPTSDWRDRAAQIRRQNPTVGPREVYDMLRDEGYDLPPFSSIR